MIKILFYENSVNQAFLKREMEVKFGGTKLVCGMLDLLAILIPIPIMLPVGFRYGYVYFDKNDVLTNAIKEFNCQKNFTYLGLWVTDGGGPDEGFGYLKPKNGVTCPDEKLR